MAKFTIFLRTFDTNRDGTHPISLRLSKNGQKKFIGLGLTATPTQWDEKFCRYKKDKRINPEHVKNNAFLNEQETKIEKIISTFADNNIDWTLNQFEDAFLNRSKHGRVKPFIENLIKTMRDTDHNGNAECYDRTLHMLELFDKKFDKKVFSEIDIKYIKAFDVFLQTPRETVYTSKKGNKRVVQRPGNSGNSRRIHFKTLRSILNLAIEAKEASQSTYPFGKGGFQVAKLGEETEKRYLPSNHLVKVKQETDIKLKKTSIYAQKLFLFSYFCYGMSFKDMALLKPENVKMLENGQYIVYKRSKTRHNKESKSISIKLTEELKTIIAELCEISQPVDDYLLPIISVKELTGLTLYKHIKNRLSRFNKNLKTMAKELGIDNVHITSYVSRHTMAMTLQNNKIPREIISQILDHKEMKTTNTYLDSFSSNIIDEAATVL